jgi:hypothetical protein
MLGGFRKELIAEINPRRSLRRDGNRLSSREIAVGWDPEAWAPTPAARNVITTPILIAHGDHRTRNATAQDSPRIP